MLCWWCGGGVVVNGKSYLDSDSHYFTSQLHVKTHTKGPKRKVNMPFPYQNQCLTIVVVGASGDLAKKRPTHLYLNYIARATCPNKVH